MADLNKSQNFTISFIPSIRNRFVKEPEEFIEGVLVCAHCGNEIKGHYGWHCPHCGLPIREIEI